MRLRTRREAGVPFRKAAVAAFFSSFGPGFRTGLTLTR